MERVTGQQSMVRSWLYITPNTGHVQRPSSTPFATHPVLPSTRLLPPLLLGQWSITVLKWAQSRQG